MNKNISILVALVAVSIGYYVFSQATPTMAPVTPVAEQSAKNTMPAQENGSTKKVIEIEAGSFYYKPDMLTLKKGETVVLKLKSVSMMHDFKIDELNFSIPVTKSGNEATVEFTPDKVGEFEYYCTVGNGFHKKQGQVGKLIVTE